MGIGMDGGTNMPPSKPMMGGGPSVLPVNPMGGGSQVQQPPMSGGINQMMKKGGKVKDKASTSSPAKKEAVKGWGMARGARKAKTY